MSIPLVQEATKDDINTSIIAIKRNIERINMLLGLSNSEEIDTSEFVKKSDIVDVVEAGNMNPVTSNAVVPVDEVTSGNMQSVTSNAVAEKIEDLMFDLRGNNSVTLDLSRYASDDASTYHSGVICGVLAGVCGFSLLYKSDAGTITRYGIETPYLTINHNVDAKTVTFTNTAVNEIAVKGFIRVHP